MAKQTREQMRAYRKKRRDAAKAAYLCRVCLVNPQAQFYTACDVCRENERLRYPGANPNPPDPAAVYEEENPLDHKPGTY